MQKEEVKRNKLEGFHKPFFSSFNFLIFNMHVINIYFKTIGVLDIFQKKSNLILEIFLERIYGFSDKNEAFKAYFIINV